MPDPISSSILPPPDSDVCNVDSAPSLTCHGPEAAASAPTPAGNSCTVAGQSAEPAVSRATSELLQKFSSTDYSALLAGSAPSAPPPSIAAPSGPPALTVRHAQIDLQTGIPQLVDRGTLGKLQVTAKGDLLNASAHIGALNEDGSHGVNVGVGANLVNGEVTLDYRGWSFSMGLGISLGGSIASGGGRDLDADDTPERCFKMTLGPLTLGECDEL